MRYFIVVVLILIGFSCSKKSSLVIQNKPEHIVHIDSVFLSIQAEIGEINCETENCDSLILCYNKYFKYLQKDAKNISVAKEKKIVECAIMMAESGSTRAHTLLMEAFNSPFTSKKHGIFSWASRLRGEEAFEITLEYMRQSKGENPGVAVSRAWDIYNNVVSYMIIFKDGTDPRLFLLENNKFVEADRQNNIENWLTTDFIEILKKEIKEGRVVFKKYGE